jgi:hypothetical protein
VCLLYARKQTSFTAAGMSALPPKADIVRHGGNVRFVPKADLAGGLGQQQQLAYHGTALQHFVRSRCLAKR